MNELQFMYAGTDYFFDIFTLNEILKQKNIPVDERKQILKRDYNYRLNQLLDKTKKITLSYYIYATNFNFKFFDEDSDLLNNFYSEDTLKQEEKIEDAEDKILGWIDFIMDLY